MEKFEWIDIWNNSDATLSFISEQKEKVHETIVSYWDLLEKINKWEFKEVVNLVKINGFDLSLESKDIFVNWLMNWLLYKDVWSIDIKDVIDFMFLYEDPSVFYNWVVSSWYLELGYYIKESYPELQEYDDKFMDEYLKMLLERQKWWFKFNWVNVNYNEIFYSLTKNPTKYIQIYNNKDYFLKYDISLSLLFDVYREIDNLVYDSFFTLSSTIFYSQKLDIQESDEYFERSLINLQNKNTKTGVYITMIMREKNCDILLLNENKVIEPRPSKIVSFFTDKQIYIKELEKYNLFYKKGLEEKNSPYVVLFFNSQPTSKTTWPIINLNNREALNGDLFKKIA